MGKGAKKLRKRAPRPPVEPVVTVPRAVVVDAPATPWARHEGATAAVAPVAPAGKKAKRAKDGKPAKVAKIKTKGGTSARTEQTDAGERPPTNLAAYAHAAALTGAKKIKKKCCRSTPRCKGCPVVLMRAARLQESGMTGKDLKKAVKRARAA